MNWLRLILVAAGVLLFVGIYWWGRRSKTNVADQPSAKLQSRGPQGTAPTLSDEVTARRSAEPTIGAMDEVAADSLPPMTAHGMPGSAARPIANDDRVELFDDAPGTPAARVEVKSASPAKPAAQADRPLKPAAAQRKIIALRLSAGATKIEGARLKTLFDGSGLTFGRYNIYHRMHDPHTPLFSVASMVEPGTFDPQAMTGVPFPGVTIFMQLPGPLDGQEMLSQMLAFARQLEQSVGGALQDERGVALNESREQRLRDDVANFLHLLGQPS